MVRHIVMWNYKEDDSCGAKIKNDLERLKEIVCGVIDIEVILNASSSSTKDIMLNSLFESEEALNSYQKHEEHIKVVEYINETLEGRVCFDYIE